MPPPSALNRLLSDAKHGYKIKEINLSHDSLTDADLGDVLFLITHDMCRSLRVVDVSNNNFNDRSIRDIVIACHKLEKERRNKLNNSGNTSSSGTSCVIWVACEYNKVSNPTQLLDTLFETDEVDYCQVSEPLLCLRSGECKKLKKKKTISVTIHLPNFKKQKGSSSSSSSSVCNPVPESNLASSVDNSYSSSGRNNGDRSNNRTGNTNQQSQSQNQSANNNNNSRSNQNNSNNDRDRTQTDRRGGDRGRRVNNNINEDDQDSRDNWIDASTVNSRRNNTTSNVPQQQQQQSTHQSQSQNSSRRGDRERGDHRGDRGEKQQQQQRGGHDDRSDNHHSQRARGERGDRGDRSGRNYNDNNISGGNTNGTSSDKRSNRFHDSRERNIGRNDNIRSRDGDDRRDRDHNQKSYYNSSNLDSSGTINNNSNMRSNNNRNKRSRSRRRAQNNNNQQRNYQQHNSQGGQATNHDDSDSDNYTESDNDDDDIHAPSSRNNQNQQSGSHSKPSVTLKRNPTATPNDRNDRSNNHNQMMSNSISSTPGPSGTHKSSLNSFSSNSNLSNTKSNTTVTSDEKKRIPAALDVALDDTIKRKLLNNNTGNQQQNHLQQQQSSNVTEGKLPGSSITNNNQGTNNTSSISSTTTASAGPREGPPPPATTSVVSQSQQVLAAPSLTGASSTTTASTSAAGGTGPGSGHGSGGGTSESKTPTTVTQTITNTGVTPGGTAPVIRRVVSPKTGSTVVPTAATIQAQQQQQAAAAAQNSTANSSTTVTGAGGPGGNPNAQQNSNSNSSNQQPIQTSHLHQTMNPYGGSGGSGGNSTNSVAIAQSDNPYAAMQSSGTAAVSVTTPNNQQQASPQANSNVIVGTSNGVVTQQQGPIGGQPGSASASATSSSVASPAHAGTAQGLPSNSNQVLTISSLKSGSNTSSDNTMMMSSKEKSLVNQTGNSIDNHVTTSKVQDNHSATTGEVTQQSSKDAQTVRSERGADRDRTRAERKRDKDKDKGGKQRKRSRSRDRQGGNRKRDKKGRRKDRGNSYRRKRSPSKSKSQTSSSESDDDVGDKTKNNNINSKAKLPGGFDVGPLGKKTGFDVGPPNVGQQVQGTTVSGPKYAKSGGLPPFAVPQTYGPHGPHNIGQHGQHGQQQLHGQHNQYQVGHPLHSHYNQHPYGGPIGAGLGGFNHHQQYPGLPQQQYGPGGVPLTVQQQQMLQQQQLQNSLHPNNNSIAISSPRDSDPRESVSSDSRGGGNNGGANGTLGGQGNHNNSSGTGTDVSTKGLEKETISAGMGGPNSATGTNNNRPKTAAEIMATLPDIKKHIKNLQLEFIQMKQTYEAEIANNTGNAANLIKGEKDQKNYYQCAIGEVVGEGYKCVSKLGTGVYSSVWYCKKWEKEEGREVNVAVKLVSLNDGFSDDVYGREVNVSVKLIRKEKMMTSVAKQEIKLYQTMADKGPKLDRHGSAFLMYLYKNDHFVYHGHVTMVFPLMKFDLRMAKEYYKQEKGFPLQTVALWGIQILFGLRCLNKLGIVHADLKPDNVLLNHDKTRAQICDFGTSMYTNQLIESKEIQPRFYRAPEIILGVTYNTGIDMWSCGATLYELATGKILFIGKSDNEMLSKQMDVSGGMPLRMAKEGRYSKDHFDPKYGDFLLADDLDPINEKPTILKTSSMRKRNMVLNDFSECVYTVSTSNSENPMGKKVRASADMLEQFQDLLQKCLALDPKTRVLPEDSVKHRFFELAVSEDQKPNLLGK